MYYVIPTFSCNDNVKLLEYYLPLSFLVKLRMGSGSCLSVCSLSSAPFLPVKTLSPSSNGTFPMMRPTDAVEVTPEVTCTVNYKIFYSKVNVCLNPASMRFINALLIFKLITRFYAILLVDSSAHQYCCRIWSLTRVKAELQDEGHQDIKLC